MVSLRLHGEICCALSHGPEPFVRDPGRNGEIRDPRELEQKTLKCGRCLAKTPPEFLGILNQM